MEHVLAWISRYGYAGIFALLMFGIAGLPIPDETLLVFSGYLISRGRLNPTLAFVAGLAGSMSGISLSYALGRFVGQPLIFRYGRHLGFTPVHLEKVRCWYARAGNWLLTFGYFIPGVRHFTALVAGTSRLAYPVFAAFAYGGAVIWVATFLAIGWAVGDNWELAVAAVHRYSFATICILLCLAAIVWWFRRRKLF